MLAIRTSGDAQDLIGTYRSLTQIEDVFKNMKNVDFLRWQPAYHWTDQKLNVHGLYCVLALLYPQATMAHPKDHITLSRMSPTQRRLADALEIATALKA